VWAERRSNAVEVPAATQSPLQNRQYRSAKVPSSPVSGFLDDYVVGHDRAEHLTARMPVTAADHAAQRAGLHAADEPVSDPALLDELPTCPASIAWMNL
jgi:hypothetical protein